MALICSEGLCLATSTKALCQHQNALDLRIRGPRAHEAFMLEAPENCCVIVNAFEKCVVANKGVRMIVVQVDATSTGSPLKRNETHILAWGDDRYETYKPQEFLLSQHSRKNGIDRLAAAILFEVPLSCPSSLLYFEFGPEWTLLALDSWLGSHQIRTRHDIKPPDIEKIRDRARQQRMTSRSQGDATSEELRREAGDEDLSALHHVAEPGNAAIQQKTPKRKDPMHVLCVWTDKRAEHPEMRVCVACAPREETQISLEADGGAIEPVSRYANHLTPDMMIAHLVFPAAHGAFLLCPGREKTALATDQTHTLPCEKSCVLCSARPPDATFVHGNTGHKICCIECALKITDPSFAPPPALCPVCREPIDRVIKTFE